jgi:hypothetical protein
MISSVDTPTRIRATVIPEIPHPREGGSTASAAALSPGGRPKRRLDWFRVRAYAVIAIFLAVFWASVWALVAG